MVDKDTLIVLESPDYGQALNLISDIIDAIKAEPSICLACYFKQGCERSDNCYCEAAMMAYAVEQEHENDRLADLATETDDYHLSLWNGQ